VLRERERSKDVKTLKKSLESTRRFSYREMSTREDDKGDEEETSVKIDLLSKKTKSLKELKEYLQSGFEKKFPNIFFRNTGETSLHFAAFLGDINAMKRLITEDNADVNVVDNRKMVPLHYAIRYGHLDVVKVLLENGADVNAVSDCNNTALHVAVRGGRVDMMKVLLQNGADVSVVCHYQNTTALHEACKWCDADDDERYASTVSKMVLQLLCFRAEIDEQAIDASNHSDFPQPIRDVLISLRDGKGTKTTFVSNEERHYMWNLAFVLTIKHPSIAFKTYYMIRSFVTFHGICMGPGYGLGEEGSAWSVDDYCAW